jgi:hypothetical protein
VALPANFPGPVVVAQHMASRFTGVFARRPATLCEVAVIGVTRQTLLEGAVYIARGEADLAFTTTGLSEVTLPAPASPKHLWHPRVTRMVESAMNVLPAERPVGVQLTGMGDDGARAMANPADAWRSHHRLVRGNLGGAWHAGELVPMHGAELGVVPYRTRLVASDLHHHKALVGILRDQIGNVCAETEAAPLDMLTRLNEVDRHVQDIAFLSRAYTSDKVADLMDGSKARMAENRPLLDEFAKAAVRRHLESRPTRWR